MKAEIAIIASFSTFLRGFVEYYSSVHLGALAVKDILVYLEEPELEPDPKKFFLPVNELPLWELAGKTTLIKLLCGLLRPSEGEILLDGKLQSAFTSTEYSQYFSAIFQDIHLLPLTIGSNISMTEEDKWDEKNFGNASNKQD